MECSSGHRQCCQENLPTSSSMLTTKEALGLYKISSGPEEVGAESGFPPGIQPLMWGKVCVLLLSVVSHSLQWCFLPTSFR